MIENGEGVRNQLRVMRTLYTIGDERKQMLRAKPPSDVFTASYLYNHKDFLNAWANDRLKVRLATLKQVAAEAGAQYVGELLAMGFETLCKLPSADVKNMALLCDFATAFDLEFPGAPSAIPAATPAPAQAAS